MIKKRKQLSWIIFFSTDVLAVSLWSLTFVLILYEKYLLFLTILFTFATILLTVVLGASFLRIHRLTKQIIGPFHDKALMIWHFTLFLTATLLAIIAGVTLELSIRADDAGHKDTAYFLYLFGILADVI